MLFLRIESINAAIISDPVLVHMKSSINLKKPQKSQLISASLLNGTTPGPANHRELLSRSKLLHLFPQFVLAHIGKYWKLSNPCRQLSTMQVDRHRRWQWNAVVVPRVLLCYSTGTRRGTHGWIWNCGTEISCTIKASSITWASTQTVLSSKMLDLGKGNKYITRWAETVNGCWSSSSLSIDPCDLIKMKSYHFC